MPAKFCAKKCACEMKRAACQIPLNSFSKRYFPSPVSKIDRIEAYAVLVKDYAVVEQAFN